MISRFPSRGSAPAHPCYQGDPERLGLLSTTLARWASAPSVIEHGLGGAGTCTILDYKTAGLTRCSRALKERRAATESAACVAWERRDCAGCFPLEAA